MREFGKIITRKTDLTDAQVQEKYKFPAIIILHDNEDKILKITHYQKNGTKTIYDFSQSASKQFVTDSIATAIAGLQDNRLEFNEFSDFPAIGDETKFYIDLSEDKIYIWDSNSQTYKSQSWDSAAIASLQASIASAQMAFQNLQNSKLDKGNYTGTAQDLKNSIDGKASISHTHDISSITNLQTSLNNKLDKGSLTSNDDSLLVEGENIEVQLSIYSEEFEQKIFNLTFTPINILGVYKNGSYLRSSEFVLNLPKSITINNYNTNDIVIVQYQHLKTDI